MSEGQRLVQALQRLGWGGTHRLQAEGFDWMFDDEAVAPFLDWFCDNVGPSNLLSEDELREFKMLQSSGEGVLEGEQLDEALKSASLPDGDQEELPLEALRENFAQMEEQLKAAQKRKEHLLQQRNILSLHHTGLMHRLTKVGSVESSAKSQYTKRLELSQSDNAQMNSALERLSRSAQELLAMYHRAPPQSAAPGRRDDGGQDRVFLSQQPLDQYHRAEERFTQQLTTFTKRQFFEGIVDLVGQDEGSRYQVLDISNPSSLAIKGEKQHVTESDCLELARLQSLYPASRRRRVKARVEEARLLAACNFAGDKLQAPDYPADIGQLSERLKEAQRKLQAVQREGSRVAETDLPNLIRENAVLQATQVLSGDYNLKIMRQDYFTSKQDELIEQLTSQQSRHKFLLMAYEVEAHRHRETHRLLAAAEHLLDSNLQGRDRRMRMMSDPSLEPSAGVRSTIDGRDLFINRLHSIIVDDEESIGRQQLFLTYGNLQEGARLLAERLSSLQEKLAATNGSQDTRLADLEATLRRCEATVYAGSATTGGQPLLSPPELVNGLARLDQTLLRLEQTIRDIIGEYNGKLKMLKGDPLLARQRRLFVYFLTDPPRLRRTVNELAQQLEARLVQ